MRGKGDRNRFRNGGPYRKDGRSVPLMSEENRRCGAARLERSKQLEREQTKYGVG